MLVYIGTIYMIRRLTMHYWGGGNKVALFRISDRNKMCKFYTTKNIRKGQIKIHK